MNIAFEENFGRVWSDNVSPYVFTLITEVPRSSAHATRFFKAQIDLAKTLQKKFNEAYLLSDFSNTSEETRELLCHYYMEFIPQMVKNKISFIAFVCPQSSFENLSPHKKEKLNEAPLGIYPTFVDALAMLNVKRMMELSQRVEAAL